MKRFFLQTSFVFSLCIAICLSGILSFAESEGYIDVKVDAPESFTHSIMINLVDNNGINYVVTPECINQWKSNYSLPAGDYLVDYVSFDTADAS